MHSFGQIDRPVGRTAISGYEIEVFDFISHETMHHAFNEEYLRIVRAAWPNDLIRFHACAGHVERLGPRLADLDGMVFQPCLPLTIPFGFSRHNPIAGRWGAYQCLRAMAKEVSGKPLRFASLLGMDANLLAVVGRRWSSVSDAPLHMILHGQLGDAMVWRSRNPFVRAGDFVSVIRKPVPPSVRIVALELGVKEAIGEISPAVESSIVTLEHPTLVSEWAEDNAALLGQAVKVAFLGHARRVKGFELFVDLARRCAGPRMEFHAIGLASYETDQLDIGAMIRKPSQTPLPRSEYVAALGEMDLVCVPLHSRAYDFTASGTVSDAIAALKPLVALRNKTLDAIAAKYGEIGYVVDSPDDLFKLLSTFDRADFERRRPGWVANLRKIREARRPTELARHYASLVAAQMPDRAISASRPVSGFAG